MLVKERRNFCMTNGAAPTGSQFLRRVARLPRGFTLIESLMAAGVLLGIVVAVTTAVTAGQQNAYEAQQRIAGTLAAEELMGRVAVDQYSKLGIWNGYTESPGSLLGPTGLHLPASMQSVGREVHVTSDMRTISGMDLRVRGQTITVRAYGSEGRTMALLTRFIPEPQS